MELNFNAKEVYDLVETELQMIGWLKATYDQMYAEIETFKWDFSCTLPHAEQSEQLEKKMKDHGIGMSCVRSMRTRLMLGNEGRVQNAS